MALRTLWRRDGLALLRDDTTGKMRAIEYGRGTESGERRSKVGWWIIANPRRARKIYRRWLVMGETHDPRARGRSCH